MWEAEKKISVTNTIVKRLICVIKNKIPHRKMGKGYKTVVLGILKKNVSTLLLIRNVQLQTRYILHIRISQNQKLKRLKISDNNEG